MRITYRVLLVGGIPITIAAAIALAAFVLLNEADKARSGAVLAGTIYRNLLSADSARNDFLETARFDRTNFYDLFRTHAEQARFDLRRLSGVVRDAEHVAAVDEAADALGRYTDDMRSLLNVTISNDQLIASMAARTDSLVTMTEEARERQHNSNADIARSLADGDQQLRTTREIVDRAHELSAALAAVQMFRATSDDPSPQGLSASERFSFELSRMRGAAERLSESLDTAAHEDLARELAQLLIAFEMTVSPTPDAAFDIRVGPGAAGSALADWVERLIKIHATEQRTLHDQMAELLAYSADAAETEQATQEIAIEALRRSNRTAAALAAGDAAEVQRIHDESESLAETVASLPISPLIQSDMVDAINAWRDGLATTIEGLSEQSQILNGMDATAQRMIDRARLLNETLTRNAERISGLVRNILILGAAVGLLLGAITALAVARSITRPLSRLQQGMMQLAADSRSGIIADFDRRDELGDMARATNVFVTEIGRREQALRKSKERADAALAELQRTQSDLIQAEKLASLGQLVAGVAHEINTPLGIALTTSTQLGDQAKQFGNAAESGKLQRSVLSRFVERMSEGTRLLYANLTRAADLVHSFKQVAADQASGERRQFLMDEWLRDLLTSLSPVLRKTRHEVIIDCPPALELDTYPGALGQVLTNLLTNALVHAYGEGDSGHLEIRVSEPRHDAVRIVFTDDGKGIPEAFVGKVYDPFFTTERRGGSTGLGLHIVYNLVTSRLQGHIHLYSKVGKGTRFTIDIPKVVKESKPEAASERPLQLEGA